MSNTRNGALVRYLMAGTGLAILMAAPGLTAAQEATSKADEKVEEVLVVGVRKSEQSAINRKKRAATTQDSIVADDVAQFPDKNVGEAISRIAGVALDRNEDGSSGGISIRGMSSAEVRIEVNGMTTLGASTDGRTANLTDLSSDLIKSVDVVKGQTADMTSGGIGGTVRIEQRTGLDFKKPYVQFNLQYQHMSLVDGWTPRATLVASRKFLDGRLGVLFNYTYDKTTYGGDIARTSNSNQGYILTADLDGSAEKTFTQPWDAAAAAVTTKAGCAALSNSTSNGGTNSRANCYNQWNDYVPSLPRYSRWLRYDTRQSLQLRLDYKATDNLNVFLNYNPNLRQIRNNDNNFSLTQPSVTLVSTGVVQTSMTNMTFSENHFLTSATLSNAGLTTQARDFQSETGTSYLQTGFDYKKNGWLVTGRFGHSEANYEYEQNVISYSISGISSITWKVDPTNGLWNYTLPSSLNTMNPAAYMPTASSGAPYSANVRIDYTPYEIETTEDVAQIDVTKTFESLGPLKSIKFGVQARNYANQTWTGAGMEVKTGVYVPTAIIQDNFRVCYPNYVTTTACSYATTAGTGTASRRNVYTLTPDQYLSLVTNTLIDLPGGQFMSGYSDRGSLQNTWATIDVNKAFGMMKDWFGLTNHNNSCLKVCTGSDGNVYEQPVSTASEETRTAYLMANFEQRLFGFDVTGNIGVRYNKWDVDGTSFILFNNSVPVSNGNGGYTFTNTFRAIEKRTVDRSTEDVLPSFNLAVWPIEDKLAVRYSLAKVAARPDVKYLVASGVVTCNELADQYDNWTDADGNDIDSSCSGRVGNPELKGYQARTTNLSVEWYPNKDSQLSLGFFRINKSSDLPIYATLYDVDMYGKKYDIPTYADGPGAITEGFELAARTAFTFLPWKFKYMGGGFNFGTSEIVSNATQYDALTGRSLPGFQQSDYYYNVNLWYDDGQLSARVAWQDRDEYRVANGGPRNAYLPDGTVGVTSTFYPGSPIFRQAAGYLDARVAYKVNKTIELFWEGKNLTNQVVTRDNSDYLSFDSSGSIPINLDTSDNGRRFYFGFRAKFE
ncbi:TonB-dependent receptor [Asticcacaulis sp. AND118]|uniref:TonB-dependent receptor n=1 Tax=Asticcacaulis sp. AND118 TaxID=2840468 RepID=UPI001CFF74A7|nr:TonB-dependent receptor [Asticcacaulis sp. AND118]UDF05706.1 TonB-dependent receptor [Asticcacaulis sp. AND118]